MLLSTAAVLFAHQFIVGASVRGTEFHVNQRINTTVESAISLGLGRFGPEDVPYETEMTVALDGSGDFTSIQAAIDATKSFPWSTITIRIKNGVYREKLDIPEWNTSIRLIGESRDGTVITFADHFDKIHRGRNSTFHTFTMRVAGNDFQARDITIENSSGAVGQAVALHVQADRAAFLNVAIRGHQDSLYLAGEGHRTYFRDCLIEGTVDFIFGEGTAFFEDCEIRSLADGFVTAPSTPNNIQYGFVFRGCRLTAAKGVEKVYLGRPWRNFGRAVFIDTWLGKHIAPAGWHNWDDHTNERTAFFAERGSQGPGARPATRVPWSRQLSASEASDYTREKILVGWLPMAGSK